MAVLAFRTSNYCTNIYMVGSARFTTRDGVNGIPVEYHAPVKQLAAQRYYIEDINDAQQKGFINLQEQEETLALKGPDDPQNRPALAATEPAPAV